MQCSCICTKEPLHNEIVCNEIHFTVYREIDVTSYYGLAGNVTQHNKNGCILYYGSRGIYYNFIFNLTGYSLIYYFEFSRRLIFFSDIWL